MRYLFILAILISSIFQANSQEFTFDIGHSFIEFSVERFGVAMVNGKFNQFEGAIQFDSVNQMITDAYVKIDVKSIDTGHKIRDEHLQSPIWLDVDNFPTMEFKSTSVSRIDDGFVIKGDLLIHGVSKPVEIQYSMKGPLVDPTKKTTIGLEGQISINRQDFGISFNKLFGSDIPFIGNEVNISLNILAHQ